MKQETELPENEPWYKNGLRFTCSGCGDCCTGAPGFVWVTKQEIADLANAKQMEVDEFEQQYVRKIGVRKSLKEFPGNYDCVLLGKDRKCTVYDARPLQCRTWPFWESNIRTQEAWAQTCDICPGSGKGKLHNLQHIESQKNIVKM